MRIPSKEPDKQGEGDLREQPERRSEGDGVPFCLHRDASGVCSYPANGRELLEKAAELFVASMARPEGGASKEIASWLEEAPCHNCAWCKISGVWQALEKDISPGKAGFPG